MLTNYVSNANKCTQERGAIRIEVRRRGTLVYVAVTDNGHGISLADQERLCTRFSRVDNAMTREVGGTGLGLSIVKQLVELQGGGVGVESALGIGSTFWFTAPMASRTPPRGGRSRPSRHRAAHARDAWGTGERLCAQRLDAHGGRRTSVRYANRLEIESPGSPPNSMTADKMPGGQRSARNPMIVAALRDYGRDPQWPSTCAASAFRPAHGCGVCTADRWS